MKTVEIVNAYRTLGELKMTKLETSEVMKVLKARKAMRPTAESFDAFLKDVQERFKQEEGMDEAKKQEMTDAANAALEEELKREVELSVEKLSDESVAALVQENGMRLNEVYSLLGCMIE